MADIRRRLDELELFRKQAEEKLAELRKAAQAEVERRRQDGRGRNVTEIRKTVRHRPTKSESNS
jgi:hypothetical protein